MISKPTDYAAESAAEKDYQAGKTTPDPDEKEDDDDGDGEGSDPDAKAEYDEPVPERFSNGGASYDEIAAWKAEHAVKKYDEPTSKVLAKDTKK